MNNKIVDNPRHTPYDAPSRKGVRLLAAGLTAVAGSALAHKVYEGNVAENNAQPACEVVVKPGDTLSGLEKGLGDRVHSAHEVQNDGSLTDIANPSMIKAGETLNFDHVSPDACKAIGGLVVEQSNTGSTATASK